MSRRYLLSLLFMLVVCDCFEVTKLVVADDAKPQGPVILIPPRGKYSEIRCVQSVDGEKTFATTPVWLLGKFGERNKGNLTPANDPLLLKVAIEAAGIGRFDVQAASISFEVDASQNRVADMIGVTIRGMSNSGWQFADNPRLRVVADGRAYDCGNLTRNADGELLKRTLTNKVQLFKETLVGTVPLAGAVQIAKASRSTIEIGGVQHSLDSARLVWTRKELREARGEPPPKTGKSKFPTKTTKKPVSENSSNTDDEIVLEVGAKTALMDLLSELSDATQTRTGARIAVDPNLANALNARSAAERNARESALSAAEREKRDANEAKAEGSLALAEKSIADKKTKLAKTLLKGLIDRYPETQASKKAEELLKSLSD